MKGFPTFTLEFVRKRLPSAQGWAYYAWANMDAATAMGGRLELKGDGYVAQEAEKIKRKRKQHG